MRRLGPALLAAALAAPLAAAGPARAAQDGVDIALVLAVDVSDSVSAERYVLQMEGLAKAFEDRDIEEAILAGPHHAMLVSLVEWSDKAVVSVPWSVIASAADAESFARRIRAAPRAASDFTCMSTALQTVAGKVLPFRPLPAERTVIDVSGDGSDNCNPLVPVTAVRDHLVAAGATINGLPILEGDEAATLEGWYRDHVIGGANSFLIPAKGFGDIERAMRRKFLQEVSQLPIRP